VNDVSHGLAAELLLVAIPGLSFLFSALFRFCAPHLSQDQIKFSRVFNSRVLLTLTLCFLDVPISAQTARKPAPRDSASDHKLISIRVTGSQRFTPEEIIAASGLKIGDSATEDDFKKATNELGDTGLFTDISYSYVNSGTGTKLDLQLADTDKVVPARFENFVWFSDADLISKIHEREPLFKGVVAVGGNLSDRISDALQSLLLQRSLSAHANYVREGGGENGPIDAVNFRADDMNIRIHSVFFPGAPPAEQGALSAAARKLERKDYLRSDVNAYARAALLPVYLERGFLKASFSEPQAKVVEQDSDETQVDVTLPSTPGFQYKISSFTWSANTAFPSDKLQSMIHGQPGQAANAVQLKADLEEVQKLYGTRGYMTASVKPDPDFDDANSSVVYNLDVHEGDVFHLGDLDISGADQKTIDRLRNAWTLTPTDPYDSSYPKRFLKDSWKLLPTTTDWTVSFHEGVNEKDKTVDVSIRYSKKVG
jgi:outer membrane protein assembly factor BamA